MKNGKLKELEELGESLDWLFDAYKNEILKKRLAESEYYADVVLTPWSLEDKIEFSEKIYSIIVKYQKRDN